MDITTVTVAVLAAAVVLRLGLIAFGAALVLRPARECPACFRDTFRIHRPLFERVLRIAEWRWCPTCGWQGPSRKAEPAAWTSKSVASGT